jgi:Flp pilus assembly protein TadD/TolB-like protein
LPDIFLSYNREDQARARLFAEAFERDGLTVWWDVGLRTGEAYDAVTENALRSAKAVVVLWSTRSVQSRWVRAEAALALRQKTFAPCMIEPCERPIMFELTQTADLSHWSGDTNDAAWQRFLADVRRLVNGVAELELGVVTPPGSLQPAQQRNRLARLWLELKRRRIFRAGALYAVVAWALIQAASIAFPAFGLPDLAMRALLVAASAGFPIALVVAWVFEFSARGVEVTAPLDGKYPGGIRPERWWLRPLIGAPLIALIVGVAAWLWTARLQETGPSEFDATGRSDSPPIVAVLPLENLTGDRQLDWTGNGIAMLVRDDLARSRHLAVVSAARTLRLTADAESGYAALSRNAAAAGITHLLSGEVLNTPKGMTVATRLTDLRRNIDLTSSRQQGLAADAVLGVSTAIAAMVKQGLGVPATEKVDLFATNFATRNSSAYESFLAGMENFLRFKYEDARNAFEIALQKAPDFAMARYRLAHTLAMLGDTQGALREIRIAKRDAQALPALEQEYIAAAESYFARSYPAAEQHYRQILKNYPFETEARLFLIYILYDQNKYDEALASATALAAQEPDSEVAWGAIGDLNLRLKRFDDADRALKRYVELAPENPNAQLLLGDSMLLRRRYDEARTYYGEAIKLDPGFGSAQLQLAYVDYLTDDWNSALARFSSLATSDMHNDSDRITAAFEWAHLLRASGQCSEADQVLDRFQPKIAQEQIREALSLALRGYCELDNGNVVAARALARDAVARSPGRATRYLFLQALTEIEARDASAAETTIRAIEGEQAQADDAGESSRKAAQYLTGMLQMTRGDTAGAASSMRHASQGPGQDYDLYQLGLARALLAEGQTADAEVAARGAIAARDPGDPRIEQETSRRRAMLLELQLLLQVGDQARAEVLRQTLASMWKNADPEFTPRAELLRLDARP